MPTYPETLTHPWELEEPPYEEEEDDKATESPRLTDPFNYFGALGAMPNPKFGGVNHVGHLHSISCLLLFKFQSC